MRAEVSLRPGRDRRSARARRAPRRTVRRLVLFGVALLLALLIGAAGIFTGSANKIPKGVSIFGVELGGMRPTDAEAKLEEFATRLSSVPVVFRVAGESFLLRPAELDARVDWKQVVAEALEAGDGPLALRGFKRLKVRLFGVEVEPKAALHEAGLDQEVALLADRVDVVAREASVELDGVVTRVIPAKRGRKLNVEGARAAIAAALIGFDRHPIQLPVEIDPPTVTAATLEPLVAQVRAVLSAPVRLGYGETHWRLRPARLATFLVLPTEGANELSIGGAAADRYFSALTRAFDRKPKDASFRTTGSGRVEIVPSVNGRSLDVTLTERALLEAALTSARRDAPLVVTTSSPKFTTENAQAMKIETTLSAYGTAYAGTEDRIQNLRLAVSLLDGTFIKPGASFSFNETVGPRTVERGFRVAPVIIGSEYDEDVGGGVSQVATTVFNAAWEAGLKITERNPHALYISRYAAGRDATVNYPNLDLSFRNDTDGWLLLRGSHDDEGISITILGPHPGRRVVSEAGPLAEIAPPKLEKVRDPMLLKGEKIVEDEGEPARGITVKRTVYVGDKVVLYREVWPTRYRSEPKIVRIGTKPKPKKPAEKNGGTSTDKARPGLSEPVAPGPAGPEQALVPTEAVAPTP
jgi:vancomycin resistance protein YoaR